MSDVPPIALSAHHWVIVRDILAHLVPQYAVWAFGSRARQTAKPYSDLDLAVITHQPLDLSLRAALAAAFDQSDLTIKVDVVDWASASETFRQVIERDKIVLQAAAASPGGPP